MNDVPMPGGEDARHECESAERAGIAAAIGEAIDQGWWDPAQPFPDKLKPANEPEWWTRAITGEDDPSWSTATALDAAVISFLIPILHPNKIGDEYDEHLRMLSDIEATVLREHQDER